MVLASYLLVTLLGNPQTVSAAEPDNLAKTVNEFFMAWLLERDAKKATIFLAEEAFEAQCGSDENDPRTERKELLRGHEDGFAAAIDFFDPNVPSTYLHK